MHKLHSAIILGMLQLAALGQTSIASSEESRSVYRIVATQCKAGNKAGSGFFVSRAPNIIADPGPWFITALHVIAGCSEIVARRPHTNAAEIRLQVKAFSTFYDTAVLTPIVKPTVYPPGLELATTPQRNRVAVWLLGYQMENQVLTVREFQMDPNMFPLSRLAPPGEARITIPDRNADVFHVPAGPTRGDSGGPIVEPVTKRVVALVSGGHLSGAVSNNWAIPVSKFKPSDFTIGQFDVSVSDKRFLPILFEGPGIRKVLERIPGLEFVTPDFKFWIMSKEVSNEVYSKVTGKQRLNPEMPYEADSPHEAQAFCKVIGGRLPSVPEWQTAAANPDRSNCGCLYNAAGLASCASDEPSKKGLKPDQYERTASVGQFPPNEFGIFDMYGNLWEWVQVSQTSIKLIGGGYDTPCRQFRPDKVVARRPNALKGFRCVLPFTEEDKVAWLQ